MPILYYNTTLLFSKVFIQFRIWTKYNWNQYILRTDTETVPKSNWQIVDIDAPPHIYVTARSLSWLGTGTSIKIGEVKLVIDNRRNDKQTRYSLHIEHPHLRWMSFFYL